MKIESVVAGTRNRGKLAELRQILEPEGIAVSGLEAFPGAPDVEETGATFEENARLKALALASALDRVVLADDSGLEVDALSGDPGVRSARFAGEPQDPAANNALLLERLKDVPEGARSARFRCAVCLAGPEGVLAEAQGVAEGAIAFAPRGRGGFGYDPLVISRDLGCTFAEGAPAAKNAVSHRGRALRSLLAELKARGRL